MECNQQDFASFDHENLDSAEALPCRVLDAANIRDPDEVLAWTTADPNQCLGCYSFLQVFGKFLFLPCFWPHMVLLSPCLCLSFCTNWSRFLCQYWILVDYELKVVEMEYDYCCCCPGCLTSGQSVKTIPLENITDCGLQAQGSGLCNVLGAETPLLYVDTASYSPQSGQGGHEALGVGLADSEGMMDAILCQRDQILGRSGRRSSQGLSRRATYIEARASGAGKSRQSSNKSRLMELSDLRCQDLISKEEFERKRQQILDTL